MTPISAWAKMIFSPMLLAVMLLFDILAIGFATNGSTAQLFLICSLNLYVGIGILTLEVPPRKRNVVLLLSLFAIIGHAYQFYFFSPQESHLDIARQGNIIAFLVDLIIKELPVLLFALYLVSNGRWKNLFGKIEYLALVVAYAVRLYFTIWFHLKIFLFFQGIHSNGI